MLSNFDIEKAIKSGEIVINNYNFKMLSPASYFLTSSSLLYQSVNKNVVDISKESTYPSCIPVDFSSGYLLKPNEFVLLRSKEEICLSQKYSALLSLPSGLGRLGINMLNSIFVNPGYGTLKPLPITIELKNESGYPIKIYPFFRLSHIIFFKLVNESTLNYDKDFGVHSNNKIGSSFYKRWK